MSAGVLVTCIGIALAALVILSPRSEVTKVNFDRIENGMTVDEANAIFGREPDRDYQTLIKGERHWANEDEGWALIVFDEDNIVESSHWIALEHGWLASFHRLIYWPWWRF